MAQNIEHFTAMLLIAFPLLLLAQPNGVSVVSKREIQALGNNGGKIGGNFFYVNRKFPDGTLFVASEVAETVPGGLLEAAGVPVGHVIVSIDGRIFLSPGEMGIYVRSFLPGRPFQVILNKPGGEAYSVRLVMNSSDKMDGTNFPLGSGKFGSPYLRASIGCLSVALSLSSSKPPDEKYKGEDQRIYNSIVDTGMSEGFSEEEVVKAVKEDSSARSIYATEKITAVLSERFLPRDILKCESLGLLRQVKQ